MGPFPLRKKRLTFLIVAIDYFTKWVEAEPMTTITEAKVTSFVWENIICKYGVPHVIISNKGKQFDNPKFQKFCHDLGVKNHYFSPRHPQANSQTEVTNKSLLKIIKTKIEGAKRAWPEELQNVLWAYGMTTRVPTGETSFRLTFGIKAVIPVEVGLTSFRVKTYEEQKNQQELNSSLDLIDEVREKVMKRMAKHKEATTIYYNRKVKVRRFNTEDLVFRKVSQATKDQSKGKLGLAWEGLYEVIRHSREGSYYLKSLDGQELP